MAGFSFVFMGVLLTIELVLLGVVLVVEALRAFSGDHYAVPITVDSEQPDLQYAEAQRTGARTERDAA